VGFPGHRLLAVVIALALAVLLRPTGAFAAEGPVAVNCVESDDVSLHTPRRGPTSLDRAFREFVSASMADVADAWQLHGPSTGCVLPGEPPATGAPSRAPCRAQPRGPPLG
jgi:hypothetical protein